MYELWYFKEGSFLVRRQTFITKWGVMLGAYILGKYCDCHDLKIYHL